MKLFVTSLLAAILVVPAMSSFAAGAAEPAVAVAAPAKASKPDLVKGEASFASCVACHGADGNSGTPANPKLAQQHPEYLVKQLQEFKSGKRANAIMQGMASTLSEADMKNVAAFYAGKEAKPGLACLPA